MNSLHKNTLVPPLEGMILLGSKDGYDVYFVPHKTGLHGITIISGPEDWECDSCLVSFIRRGGARYMKKGPWAFGIKEATSRGLLPS